VDTSPQPGGWIDSHCHPQTVDDTDAVLARARAAGVSSMVVVGTDLVTSVAAVELAACEPDVSATIGLHPHDTSAFDEQWSELVALATAPGVVAIGETGFDLHYLHSPVPAQERSFREHIRLAHALDLPLVVHTREAWAETFRVLDEERLPRRTVFHCFTGGPDEADEAIRRGAYLSFSGIVSFKGAEDVRAAAARCPEDRRLVETDSPYLAPVPHRGRPNEPAFVADVGAALAAAVGQTVESVAAATAATATEALGPLRR
jgi:TatD DNase family protein